jgi:hypothetical protein
MLHVLTRGRDVDQFMTEFTKRGATHTSLRMFDPLQKVLAAHEAAQKIHVITDNFLVTVFIN